MSRTPPCAALGALLVAVAVAMLGFAAPARASFGIEGFSVSATGEGGKAPDALAGSHPYSLVTELDFALDPASAGEPGGPFTDGDARDIRLDLPPGLIENPGAVVKCTLVQFNTPRASPFEASHSGESCPAQSQIGVVAVRAAVGGEDVVRSFGVFNLEPPPGAPSQFGFSPYGVPVTFTPHVRETAREYGLTLDLRDLSQQLDFKGIRLVIWGTPWNLVHNGERGNCLNEAEPGFPWAKCPISPPIPLHAPQAYLTLPANCDGPLGFHVSARSWQQPGQSVDATAVARDGEGRPLPLEDCGSLPFLPHPVARLSTARTSSPSGFDLSVDGNAVGLLDPRQRAASQAKKAVVVLPEGLTVNPSVGAGLSTCSPAQYAAETVSSAPGAGCPNPSKIGEVRLETPLLEGAIEGSLFFAQPDDPATAAPGAENPFDTLLALYMVVKAPQRGIMIKVAGRVDLDPATGRIVAGFDDLPQIPYLHFEVNLRDGQRSPLATPAACGSYSTRIEMSPWLDPSSTARFDSGFGLDSGIGGGSCPGGALAPFAPRATAGTLNSNAGSYTPFYLHLTRADPEQEITSYSAKLPPGLLGKVKGVALCPEAAIEAAKHRRGFEELAHPSCPAGSEIGHTVTGYGLGSTLAYAPGKLYLAGPYRGQPFSVVAVDAATVGPFDLGVIVVRSAIRIDPHSAQVSIDSAGSDPIPHIIAGFPIRLRDIRVHIDRPGFTLNPTSCEPFSVASTLTGSGARFSDPGDDTSASADSPFQAINCSALGFAPRLGLRLLGSPRRGGFPGLRAVLRPRPGDANIGRVAVTMPPSEFLAQGHIDAVCTPVQFAAGRCPAGSVYGHARAITPLLGEPLQGPVYLRSNGDERPLPDLVAALRGGGGEVDVVGRIDSHRAGIRGVFDLLPDAPVSEVTMTFAGGRRGLLENAADLCREPAFATARLVGQNNRTARLRPRLRAKCGKHRRGGQGHANKGKGRG